MHPGQKINWFFEQIVWNFEINCSPRCGNAFWPKNHWFFEQIVWNFEINCSPRCGDCGRETWKFVRVRAKEEVNKLPERTWQICCANWEILDKYLRNAWQILEKYLTNVWEIHDIYLTNTWEMLEKYLTNTWEILEKYLTNTWLMLDKAFLSFGGCQLVSLLIG